MNEADNIQDAMTTLLQQAKQASFQMPVLTTDEKNQALLVLASLLMQESEALLVANQKDLEREAECLSSSLYQRLKLDSAKLAQLARGIQDVANLPDPVGHVQLRTLLDDGLVLERVSTPIGVIAVVFESRPDVLPQVLSLILKSGNTVIFKGGSEAIESNQAFMKLVVQLNQACPFLPEGWAQMVTTRADFQALLAHHEVIDLVIPRGSNQLVQQVMAATQCPVLGHADGVCHLYVHASANLANAVAVVLDAKAQYPSACNALETVLVDKALAKTFLPDIEQAARVQGITLKGCELTRKLLPWLELVSESDWHTEYGELTLAVKIVNHVADAIEHINTYGSHHTDGILATEPEVIERFLNQVDSASVFANASTRFADGFRYGFGAEIGISTAKTHARGPVGLEGLIIYKYKLRGSGHCVTLYTGETPKPFRHRPLI